MNKYIAILSLCALPIAAAAAVPQPQRDYRVLSGTWQLTRAYISGRALSAAQVRHTILITDGNRFWLPNASSAGTHPSGTFTLNTRARPKQVDSRGGGNNASLVTRGIYEITNPMHQRECWGAPGGARPTSFTPNGCRILQYWTKIGGVPRGY
jgi:uncharacterized protein (TIGR03067 family)